MRLLYCTCRSTRPATNWLVSAGRYPTTVSRTIGWYREGDTGKAPYSRSLVDLQAYQAALAT